MRFGVVIFPGSNCEQDVIRATQFLGFESEYIWHGDTDLSGFDAIVLPGGFSYGDYIRTRRRRALLARHGRGRALRREGRAGARHLQRLPDPCEAHLLPGALLRNRGPQVHLQAGEPARRGERLPVARPARRHDPRRSRSTTTRATTTATPRRSSASTPTARSCCATSRPTARPPRAAALPTARSTTSPASATSAATSSASCRTPSASSTRSRAAPTASRSSRRSCAALAEVAG